MLGNSFPNHKQSFPTDHAFIIVNTFSMAPGPLVVEDNALKIL